MKWGTDLIFKFLDSYSQQRCLWDYSDSNFKNKNKRNFAMQQIIMDMNVEGLTTEELKLKIHSIRNTYTNEKRKIEKSRRSGSGADDIYISKLPWFKLADAFLQKIVSQRKNHTNLKHEDAINTHMLDSDFSKIGTDEASTQLTEDEGSHLSLLDQHPYSESTNAIISENNLGISVFSPSFERNVGTLRKKRKVNNDNPFLFLNNAVNVLREVGKLKEEDEIAAFGNSIVAQMRKLPELDVLDLMEQIQTLVINKRRENVQKCIHKSKGQYINVTDNSDYETT